MAIDGGMRGRLTVGMRLEAGYKGSRHIAEVVAGEDGKVRFRLADGREFTSPSAAGSALMGGIACNGWRFWSLAGNTADAPSEAADEAHEAPQSQRPACPRCGKRFVGAAQLAHHEANADRLCITE